MCRLYAFRATEDTKVECTLVHSQNALITQSEQDQSGLSHSHGWGIVTYDGQQMEDRQAWAAYHGEHFKRSAAKIYASVVLAHVRRATVGEPSVANTHPFKHKQWSFAHNGTVPSFKKVRPKLLAAMGTAHQQLIQGETDSEHMFHYALSLIERFPDRPLESIVRQLVSDTLGWLAQVSEKGKPGLNVILTDGDIIVGSRLGRTLFYSQRTGVYDCEICGFPHIHHELNRDHRAVVVASEPLTQEDWVAFPDECTWQITNTAELSINDSPFTLSENTPTTASSPQ